MPYPMEERYSTWQKKPVTTYIVNPRSPDAAHRSISGAIARAAPYDRIELVGGEYYESFSITFPIEIVSAEGEDAHISFRGPVLQCAQGVSEAYIADLQLTSKSKGRNDAAVVITNGSPQFFRCSINSVLVSGFGAPTFERCECALSPAGTGLRFIDSGGGRVKDCKIHSHQSACVEIDTAGELLFVECTIHQPLKAMGIVCQAVLSSSRHKLDSAVAAEMDALQLLRANDSNGDDDDDDGAGDAGVGGGSSAAASPLACGAVVFERNTISQSQIVAAAAAFDAQGPSLMSSFGESACAYISHGARPRFAGNHFTEGDIGLIIELGGAPRLTMNLFRAQRTAGILIVLPPERPLPSTPAASASDPEGNALALLSAGRSVHVGKSNLFERCKIGVDVHCCAGEDLLRFAEFDPNSELRLPTTSPAPPTPPLPARRHSSAAASPPTKRIQQQLLPVEERDWLQLKSDVAVDPAAIPQRAVPTVLSAVDGILRDVVRAFPRAALNQAVVHAAGHDTVLGTEAQIDSITADNGVGFATYGISLDERHALHEPQHQAQLVSSLVGKMNAAASEAHGKVAARARRRIARLRGPGVVIADSRFLNCAGVGVRFTNAARGLIDDCTFEGCSGCGVLVDRGSSPMVLASRFDHNGVCGALICNGSAPFFAANEFTNHSNEGIRVESGARGIVAVNFVVGNRGCGARIASSASPVVYANEFRDNRRGGVVAVEGARPLITANIFVANSDAQVMIGEYAAPRILRNDIECGVGAGVRYVACASGEMLGNNVCENKEDGIVLETDADPHIEDNVVQRNRCHGIRCHDEAGGSLVSNKIVENQGAGVVVAQGSSPTVRNNTVRGNMQGGISISEEGFGYIEKNIVRENLIGNVIVTGKGSAPEIVSNEITRSGSGPGVLCDDASAGEVRRNLIFDNAVCGVLVRCKADPHLAHNRVVREKIGIVVDSNGRGELRENTIAHCFDTGLLIQLGGSPLVVANSMYANADAAIVVGQQALGDVEHNDITKNGIGVRCGTSVSDAEVQALLDTTVSELATSQEVQATRGSSTDGSFTTSMRSSRRPPHHSSRPSRGGEHSTGSAHTRLDQQAVVLKNNKIVENTICGVLLESGACGRFISNSIHSNAGFGVIGDVAFSGAAPGSAAPLTSAKQPRALRSVVGGGGASFESNKLHSHHKANIAFVNHPGDNRFCFDSNDLWDAPIGILLQNSSFVASVRRNKIHHVLEGIRCESFSRGVFSENAVTRCRHAGAVITTGAHPKFEAGSVFSHTEYCGVCCEEGAAGRFTETTIEFNRVCGILVVSAPPGIQRVREHSAVEAGRHMASGPPTTVFVRNTVSRNDGHGVLVLSSHTDVSQTVARTTQRRADHGGIHTGSSERGDPTKVVEEAAHCQFVANNITQNRLCGVVVDEYEPDTYSALEGPQELDASSPRRFLDPADAALSPPNSPTKNRTPRRSKQHTNKATRAHESTDAVGGIAVSCAFSPDARVGQGDATQHALSEGQSGRRTRRTLSTTPSRKNEAADAIVLSQFESQHTDRALSHITFSANVIKANTIGIFVGGHCTPYIVANQIESNDFFGLFFRASSQPLVCGNRVTENRVTGAYCCRFSRAKLLNNVFSGNNRLNAYSQGATTTTDAITLISAKRFYVREAEEVATQSDTDAEADPQRARNERSTMALEALEKLEFGPLQLLLHTVSAFGNASATAAARALGPAHEQVFGSFIDAVKTHMNFALRSSGRAITPRSRAAHASLGDWHAAHLLELGGIDLASGGVGIWCEPGSEVECTANALRHHSLCGVLASRDILFHAGRRDDTSVDAAGSDADVLRHAQLLLAPGGLMTNLCAHRGHLGAETQSGSGSGSGSGGGASKFVGNKIHANGRIGILVQVFHNGIVHNEGDFEQRTSGGVSPLPGAAQVLKGEGNPSVRSVRPTGKKPAGTTVPPTQATDTGAATSKTKTNSGGNLPVQLSVSELLARGPQKDGVIEDAPVSLGELSSCVASDVMSSSELAALPWMLRIEENVIVDNPAHGITVQNVFLMQPDDGAAGSSTLDRLTGEAQVAGEPTSLGVSMEKASRLRHVLISDNDFRGNGISQIEAITTFVAITAVNSYTGDALNGTARPSQHTQKAPRALLFMPSHCDPRAAEGLCRHTAAHLGTLHITQCRFTEARRGVWIHLMHRGAVITHNRFTDLDETAVVVDGALACAAIAEGNVFDGNVIGLHVTGGCVSQLPASERGAVPHTRVIESSFSANQKFGVLVDGDSVAATLIIKCVISGHGKGASGIGVSGKKAAMRLVASDVAHNAVGVLLEKSVTRAELCQNQIASNVVGVRIRGGSRGVLTDNLFNENVQSGVELSGALTMPDIHGNIFRRHTKQDAHCSILTNIGLTFSLEQRTGGGGDGSDRDPVVSPDGDDGPVAICVRGDAGGMVRSNLFADNDIAVLTFQCHPSMGAPVPEDERGAALSGCSRSLDDQPEAKAESRSRSRSPPFVVFSPTFTTDAHERSLMPGLTFTNNVVRGCLVGGVIVRGIPISETLPDSAWTDGQREGAAVDEARSGLAAGATTLIEKNLFENNAVFDVKLERGGHASIRENLLLGAIISCDLGRGCVSRNYILGDSSECAILQLNGGQTRFFRNVLRNAPIALFAASGAGGLMQENMISSVGIGLDTEAYCGTQFVGNIIMDVTDCGARCKGGSLVGNELLNCPVGCVINSAAATSTTKPRKDVGLQQRTQSRTAAPFTTGVPAIPLLESNEIHSCDSDGIVVAGAAKLHKNAVHNCSTNINVLATAEMPSITENAVMDGDIGVWFAPRSSATFARNDVFDNFKVGVLVESEAQVVIDGNTISSSREQGAVEVAPDSKAQLHQNVIRNQFSPAYKKGLSGHRHAVRKRRLEAIFAEASAADADIGAVSRQMRVILAHLDALEETAEARTGSKAPIEALIGAHKAEGSVPLQLARSMSSSSFTSAGGLRRSSSSFLLKSEQAGSGGPGEAREAAGNRGEEKPAGRQAESAGRSRSIPGRTRSVVTTGIAGVKAMRSANVAKSASAKVAKAKSGIAREKGADLPASRGSRPNNRATSGSTDTPPGAGSAAACPPPHPKSVLIYIATPGARAEEVGSRLQQEIVTQQRSTAAHPRGAPSAVAVTVATATDPVVSVLRASNCDAVISIFAANDLPDAAGVQLNALHRALFAKNNTVIKKTAPITCMALATQEVDISDRALTNATFPGRHSEAVAHPLPGAVLGGDGNSGGTGGRRTGSLTVAMQPVAFFRIYGVAPIREVGGVGGPSSLTTIATWVTGTDAELTSFDVLSARIGLKEVACSGAAAAPASASASASAPQRRRTSSSGPLKRSASEKQLR